MIIDELLIALGVKADTKPLADTQKGLEGVESQSKKTDSAMSKFSTTLSNGIKKFATFATIAFTAIKTTMMGAWAYLDSTINRVEELQNSQDASLKTTKEQVEMAKKYRENMDKMSKTIENVKTRIALAFLPAMYEMSKQYGKLLDDNKDLIENGIKKLLDIATKASQVLTNFFKFINLVITGTVGWKNALIILVGVLAWVKRAMILAFITNPIFWVVAAIAGLLLLIDDFMTYLDGGESEFGDFWGECIKWVEKAKDIWSGFSDTAKSSIKALLIAFAMLTPMFGGLTGTIMTLAKAFISLSRIMLMNPIGIVVTLIGVLIYFIIDLVKWLNGGESQFSSFWEACRDVWNKIVDWTSQAIEKMINAVKGFVDDVGAFFSGVYDAIVNPFKSAFDWVANKWNSLKGMFSGGVDVKLNDRAAASVGSVSNRTSISNTYVNASIPVSGAASPQRTANAVGANLNSLAKRNSGGVAVS